MHLFFRGGTHFKYIIILSSWSLKHPPKRKKEKKNSLKKIKKNLNKSFLPKRFYKRVPNFLLRQNSHLIISCLCKQ